MGRIFVSIPSYRDPECYWTIEDLFLKAKNPQLISIGLCIQSAQSDDELVKNPVKSHHGQIRILKYDVAQSKGVCWARNKIQSLWKNEDYFLQIDSHMRFEQDWDEKLHFMYMNCNSDKPILSTYPSEYTPPNDLKTGFFSMMHFFQFNDDKVATFHSQSWSIADAPPKPIKRFTCAGGFIFAKSELIREVPYDPHIYFIGEELTFSVRAWTHGWDIFAPNGTIMYHNYNSRVRHWDDHTSWPLQNQLANERIKHLLGIHLTENEEALLEIDKYGLGTVRTIRDYEKAAKINFRLQKVYDKPISPKTIHLYQ